MVEMEITVEEAETIVRMAEDLYGEGLLEDKGVELLRKIFKAFPELKGKTWMRSASVWKEICPEGGDAELKEGSK